METLLGPSYLHNEISWDKGDHSALVAVFKWATVVKQQRPSGNLWNDWAMNYRDWPLKWKNNLCRRSLLKFKPKKLTSP